MYKAVNWNKCSDPLSKTFWDQNIRQFWVDEEISISEDKNYWNSKQMTPQMQDVYEKICVSLTTLDTFQGEYVGKIIAPNIQNLHNRAIMNYIAFMEQMHAKSYSTIFSTFSTTKRIDQLFNWAYKDKNLQKKLSIITKIYNFQYSDKNIGLYKCLVASVFLESLLFYSGFFYPLYLAGQGILVNSAEIFNLIIRDESVHGVFSGYLAQKLYNKFSKSVQKELKIWVLELVNKLVNIEKEYSYNIYEQLNLTQEVITFVKYNANKSLMNIGFESYFDVKDEDVNPIVINGLKTDTKNHDFFSVKGNGYIKNIKKVEVKDEDFKW